MDLGNQTHIKLVLLLGFQALHNFSILFFILIAILFSLTVTGNAMIVTLVSWSSSLHHPMFFFLKQLSVSDIMLTIAIVPNLLHGILKGQITMSFTACIVQFHFFSTAIASECLLLAVMSYDRYLAICEPLRYISIMHTAFRTWLVLICWFSGFIATLVVVLLINRLKFCGPNTINHFFCDFTPILELSCSDVSALKLGQMLLSAPLTMIPAIFITATYICIFITILRIPSMSGRQKAFSTCSSHLAVVGMFYGSLIALYVVPSGGNLFSADKVLSLLYTAFIPLFNPIIYSLRNQEIRRAWIKLISTRN
ncbi:hypothetical protein GDO86_000004 [Hymenochirus boettgeri]|uniref:Olfactory receptor n=1 Tax=Hymenochirus boettgeri TaxID=247094 RepID=A0A8T2KC87_9PIPI|nr:hypothetical protein GDO86_000004 [Hymenochirus boettgeri]